MIDLIFDRTEDDVVNGTEKGFYRYTDLNRVQNAVAVIRGRFVGAGYDLIPNIAMAAWAVNDVPRRRRMEDYLRAVTNLHGLIPIPGEPDLPETMDRFDWRGANAIEEFLFMADDSLDRMDGARYYCGEVYAGEVDA